MKVQKGISRYEFEERFSTSDSCYRCLAGMKWNQGYRCKKCEHVRCCEGKQPYSRRCVRCGYDESTTAGTLFHKLKFDIKIAFDMLYEITTSKKGANTIWLAERFGVQQKTAWLFRQKVQVAMKSSERYPLEGIVHVDEFEIGTPQQGEQGRSKSEKKSRVVIAVEYRDGKAGRGYARIINDYSAKSLSDIFERHIEKDANVETDGWTGYKPLKAAFPKLKQTLSDKGRNFKMLHLQIRKNKNWLRGVHSYCDAQYLQKYINEYFYRFNRRTHRASIFDNIIARILISQPVTFSTVRINAT